MVLEKIYILLLEIVIKNPQPLLGYINYNCVNSINLFVQGNVDNFFNLFYLTYTFL